MGRDGPIRVAVVGGGCAAITTAFELTRPHHQGKYQVTVYQQGWRLGGKGASGRGPSGRIEEHGLHLWLGFYENAFRLLRECYDELGRDPATQPLATWREAFFPETHVGVAQPAGPERWLNWTAFFPPADGLPGDPLAPHNPFTIKSYLVHVAALLRTLLVGLRTHGDGAPAAAPAAAWPADELAGDAGPESALGRIEAFISLASGWLRFGALTAAAGLIEAAALVEVVVRALPLYPQNLALRALDAMAGVVRRQLEGVMSADPGTGCKWEIIDLVLAILVGAVRDRLLTDPRGLDTINHYECRDWLRRNGASQRSLDSAFVRGLYDLALAYEDGDPARPGLAAGQALRGSLRMFFTYRGAMFWKMRAGMGDVVFAPFYEVLKRRGVRFEFFHRLRNVQLADAATLAPGDKPHVQGLEFDVQARVKPGGKGRGKAKGKGRPVADDSPGGAYQPLVDVKGLPCWPAAPDWSQLLDGERLRAQGRRFESHWDQRCEAQRTLCVVDDFDFVVLGVSVGAVPHVCREILACDERWRTMVAKVKTVASQAFQLWLREDMAQLGWNAPPITLSAFVKPFDTWADMSHVADAEDWPQTPKAVAYFCNVLADPPDAAALDEPGYPAARHDEVRANAVAFLDGSVQHLWPGAVRPEGGFRWELLMDAAAPAGGGAQHGIAQPTGESTLANRLASQGVADSAAPFATQYWTANVNPSDRYVLALPDSLRHRISPLDNHYDNLTVCGDWTDCGFNEGCVEAAVMSGRLAAHALSQWPPLDDIIGYDHP